MHTSSKRISRCKQNSRTLHTKLQHAANKRITRSKQNNYTLQTKFPHTANKPQHAANKKITRCKQKFHTLQTKLQHVANKKIKRCKQNFRTMQTKAKVLRAQDDVKDLDLVSWFSWFTTNMAEFLPRLHDNKTLGDKNWDEFTKPFFRKQTRGVLVFLTPAWKLCHVSCEPRQPRDKVPVLYVILCAQYFCFCLQCAEILFAACWSFVCSVREFCLLRVILLFAACGSFVCSLRESRLQRVIVLFAACNSFVCSVLEFCLQCAGVLFAALNSFPCSVHVPFLQFLFCLQCAGYDFFWRVIYACKEFFFYLQCFLFVRAVSSAGNRASMLPFYIYRKTIEILITDLSVGACCPQPMPFRLMAKRHFSKKNLCKAVQINSKVFYILLSEKRNWLTCIKLAWFC